MIIKIVWVKKKVKVRINNEALAVKVYFQGCLIAITTMTTGMISACKILNGPLNIIKLIKHNASVIPDNAM